MTGRDLFTFLSEINKQFPLPEGFKGSHGIEVKDSRLTLSLVTKVNELGHGVRFQIFYIDDNDILDEILAKAIKESYVETRGAWEY